MSKQTTKNKFPHKAPWCVVTRVESERFICTSVTPKAPLSTEEDWDNDFEVDGGEVEFEQDN